MKSFLNKNLPLIFILLIAAFLRFFQLGVNPPSLNWDEASNGYNAYSILKTGRDEFGNFMPLLFKSFGDYNLALSVYLLVPSIALFGLTEFAIRFPSALLGTISVFLTFQITKKLFKSKKIAVFASLFLTISPWHLQFSRYDHEANFMVFFVLLGYAIFLYFSTKSKGLIFSAISFGLALNTYQGAKIWVPLFLLALVIWNLKSLKKFKKKLLLPAVIILIFSLPIILNFKQSLRRGENVSIFGNKDLIENFTSGYLSHFSPNFLFTSGDINGRHAVSGMGELYVFELPLIIIGLIYLIHSKKSQSKYLLLWLLIAPIPASIATPTPHALRAITFLPLWSIFSALGLVFLINYKSRILKYFVLSALVMVAFYNVSTYLHIYYSHYPKLRAFDWQDGYKEVITYVRENQNKYSTVAISNYYGHPYIFTLLYEKYDPAKYQPQSKTGELGFDKFEFYGTSWEKKIPGPALLVSPAWQSHAPKILKEVFTRGGDLIFTISEAQ